MTEHLDKVMYVHMYTVQIQRYLINTTRSAALRAKRQQRFFVCFIYTTQLCLYFQQHFFPQKEERFSLSSRPLCQPIQTLGGKSGSEKIPFCLIYIYVYIFNKIYICLRTQWAVQFYQKTVGRFQVDTWRHWRGSSEKTSAAASSRDSAGA